MATDGNSPPLRFWTSNLAVSKAKVMRNINLQMG